MGNKAIGTWRRPKPINTQDGTGVRLYSHQHHNIWRGIYFQYSYDRKKIKFQRGQVILRRSHMLSEGNEGRLLSKCFTNSMLQKKDACTKDHINQEVQTSFWKTDLIPDISGSVNSHPTLPRLCASRCFVTG